MQSLTSVKNQIYYSLPALTGVINCNSFFGDSTYCLFLLFKYTNIFIPFQITFAATRENWLRELNSGEECEKNKTLICTQLENIVNTSTLKKSTTDILGKQLYKAFLATVVP